VGLVIALSIPVFFLLIGIEVAVGRRRGARPYRFADAIACLSCGVGQQATGLLWGAALVGAYVAVWRHAALFTWDPSWWGTWVAGVLLVDHQYYWWHRASHRCRALWAVHVVHHQSEDYNLAVALRQAWFSGFTSLPLNLPIALLGIPPEVFVGAAAIDLLYQFWIHTELIERVGPLEAVLNTPSHHRVHHGVDPAYIDRNHGGILIVWDRLYGTFTPERQRPTYGTVTPFGSGDPIRANLQPLVELVRDVRRIRSLPDKVRYVLGPPEWRPVELGGPVVIPEPVPGRVTWDPRPPGPVRRYVLGWFAAVGVVVGAALAVADRLPAAVIALIVATVVGTTWTWAPLLEGRSWAGTAERVRLALLAAVVVGAAATGALAPWAAVAALAALALSAAALPRWTPEPALQVA
jgi:sterol desaturase/sphingolipid hydroxylase (fatty acid hydroxylase superfamily)